MRELREFRERHAKFTSAGVEIAGVSLDTPESHRQWAERLRLTFPLLSDPERVAAREFGILRSVGIGTWKIELMRRTTVLAGRDGIVARVWGQVRIRGHAAQVLAAVNELGL